MRRLRMSPAMGVALTALFVSLGGTGYAVTNLAKTSVGTRQRRMSAATTKKLRHRCVNDRAALACNCIRCPPWD